MKKILFLSFFLIVAIPFAHAQTPNTADGTVPPGGACTSDTNCQDVGGQSYGCYPENNGVCTLNGDAAAGTAAVTPSAGGSGNFVPLTNLPIFGSGNLTTAPTLPAFLNSLYLYCVGIAAVLAVIQIIHAGILYMGGDSVTETKQARSLIASSLLGLVLVLSPVIVFSIINPKILNLNVGFQGIALPGAATPATPAASFTTGTCGSYSTYTSPTWTQIPANQFCPTPLGAAWANIPNGCCSGTQPSGDVCCGKNPNYVAPTAAVAPPALAQNSYSLVVQSTDKNTKQLCYVDQNSSTFSTQAACVTAYNNAISALKVPYAVNKSCTDATVHAPTGAGWSTLVNLTICPTQ